MRPYKQCIFECLDQSVAALNSKTMDDDIKEVNYPEGDYFKVIRILCFDIVQNRLIKIMIWQVVLAYSLGLTYQTFIFVSQLNFHDMLQFLPAYSKAWFGLIASLGCLSLTELILEAGKTFICWDESMLPTQQRKSPDRNRKFTTNYIIFNLCFALLIGVIYGCDRKILFDDGLIQLFGCNSIWKKLFSIIMRFNCVFVGYIIPVNLYQVVYIVNHAKMQCLLLTHYITTINDQYSKNDLYLFYESSYQSNVRRRLIHGVKQSSRIILSAKKTISAAKIFIYLYPILGSFLAISDLFFLFKGEGTFVEKYVRTGGSLLVSVTTALAVLLAGQEAEDEGVKALSGLQILNWYNWNTENKKIYINIITVLSKPFRISFSENIAINYELGMTILKTVYSACSIFINMSKKKNLEKTNN